MVWKVEVFRYLTVWFVVTNLVEVVLEPVHETIFGLAYILYPATFAGETVDKIGAFAGAVVPGLVAPIRRGASDPA